MSKSTIFYHMKILRRAGLVNIRKEEGTYYFYTVRCRALREIMPGLLKRLGDRPLALDNGRKPSTQRCTR